MPFLDRNRTKEVLNAPLKELKLLREEIDKSTGLVERSNQIEYLLEERTKLLKRASEILKDTQEKIERLRNDNNHLRNFFNELDNRGLLPKGKLFKEIWRVSSCF